MNGGLTAGRLAAAVGLLLTVACSSSAGTAALPSQPPAANAGDATVAAWLQAMAGASEDRGWSYLGETARHRYGNDSNRYVADVLAVDWTRVQWRMDGSVWDDNHYLVFVEVDGGWDAVPGFMRDRPLVQISCANHDPVGFVVLVFSEGGGWRVGSGARTGRAERGECA